MASRVELHIVLDESGKVGVSGPINDKMVCYALLDCARDAIKDHNDQAAKSAIVPARPGDLSRLSS